MLSKKMLFKIVGKNDDEKRGPADRAGLFNAEALRLLVYGLAALCPASYMFAMVPERATNHKRTQSLRTGVVENNAKNVVGKCCSKMLAKKIVRKRCSKMLAKNVDGQWGSAGEAEPFNADALCLLVCCGLHMSCAQSFLHDDRRNSTEIRFRQSLSNKECFW